MWKSFFLIVSLKLKGHLLEGTIYHISATCIHHFTWSPLHVRGLVLVAETCNTTSLLRNVMACKWVEVIKCNSENLIWRNLAMEVGKIALCIIFGSRETTIETLVCSWLEKTIFLERYNSAFHYFQHII